VGSAALSGDLKHLWDVKRGSAKLKRKPIAIYRQDCELGKGVESVIARLVMAVGFSDAAGIEVKSLTYVVQELYVRVTSAKEECLVPAELVLKLVVRGFGQEDVIE
jgi:hypothetical protein